MYICIGYMMPTIESYVLQCWKCIFVLDIRCQQFGEYVSVQDICGIGYICPIQIYIFRIGHAPTLCPKGTKKPSNLHSAPKCWHDISNINIYIQLYTPQIVGIIYPMQIYIFKIVHSPTLCPKGTKKPSNLHSSPKCWHDISNIHIYFEVTHTPQVVGIVYKYTFSTI